MQELVGRLTALDPDASEGLRIIAYFDSLVDGHASFDAFLRGAAILTGCAAGVFAPQQHLRMRVDETGLRTDPPQPTASSSWSRLSLGYGDGAGEGDDVVWIERRGSAHANDQLVLERLAWGLRLTIERRESKLPADDSSGVETLLGESAQPGERLRAAARLHLAEHEEVRAIALPPGAALPGGRTLSAVMPSPAGMLRAVIQLRSSREECEGRRGIGPWREVTSLHESWREAVVALRLSSAQTPVVDADELGSLAYLAELVDVREEPLPAVLALDGVVDHAPWALASLEAFAEHDSVRAAATTLGIHHSTAQSRCEVLEQLLGYGLRAQAGRSRLFLDLRLRRLSRACFE